MSTEVKRPAHAHPSIPRHPAAINRLAVLARRNDVEVEADDHVTDKHSVEVLVRERYLVPR